MWEASGSVMFEAWACGTPVLATAHGGLPEFVTADVGVLFEPEADGQEVRNIAGLHDGMIQGLELAADSGVRERCRAHALSYSWDALGPEYEQVYGV
jgi:glycosyltransferase involved in cell wall biosynthesis